LAKSTKIEP